MLYMGYVVFRSHLLCRRCAFERTPRCGVGALSRPWTTVGVGVSHRGIALAAAGRTTSWLGGCGFGPVENASFMPWLVGTALIHSLAVRRTRSFSQLDCAARIVAFALACSTFLDAVGCSLPCSFRGRSHARHLHPRAIRALHRGALVLYAWRTSRTVWRGLQARSRESMLLANNVFFARLRDVFLELCFPLRWTR